MSLQDLKIQKNAQIIFVNKKTGQFAYTTQGYMQPNQDGYYKGMQGAWDTETDKVICRHFDNVGMSLYSRGFERVDTEEDYQASLTLAAGAKSVYDTSKTDNKKREQLQAVSNAIVLARQGELRNLIRTIYSLSKKGISLEEIERLL